MWSLFSLKVLLTKKLLSPIAPVTSLSPVKLLTKIVIFTTLVIGLFTMTGCEKEPPSERSEISQETLSTYSPEQVEAGKALYDELCVNCHKLSAGKNTKGPQLMNVYGAKAGDLTDYSYTDAMQQAREKGWVWDVATLDPYIANPSKALPDGRMLSDPIPDAGERTAIIAYLSTLRKTPTPPVEK